MQKLPIALIAIIIVLAFIGGYFVGILNSSGNLTLNVTNQSNDSGYTGFTTQQKTTTTKYRKVNYTKRNVTPITHISTNKTKTNTT
jgi:hypothetical protein